ncbi:MAG: RecX family transcriptional regulator [Prevotella sp.]|nr:RecX family transcriptional regulator [Prevotella sp.]
MKKPISSDAALVRLETLCARSEQCGADLRRKLFTWGITGSTAEKILDSLADRRFFDDARFARAFVNDRFNFSKWGRRKITQALRLKRIDADIISDAVATIDDETYESTLRQILRSRAVRMAQPLSRDDRLRLARFAASRGFETSLILSTVNDPTLCEDS